jgi:hypothetical protein
MSKRKKFEAIDNRDGSSSYAVELNGKARAFGVLEHHAKHVPPIWTWRVTVDDQPFANGATFSLPRAKPPYCSLGRDAQRCSNRYAILRLH